MSSVCLVSPSLFSATRGSRRSRRERKDTREEQDFLTNVWNWVVCNRESYLNVADHDTVRLALFPTSSGSAPTSPPHFPHRTRITDPYDLDLFIVRGRTGTSTVNKSRPTKMPDRSEATPHVVLTDDDMSTGERREATKEE